MPKFLDEAEARGFQIERETFTDDQVDPPRERPCYMVITPSNKQWEIPEGGPHYTMCWNAADVRRVINAPLIDCTRECEVCGPDWGLS